jgi:beta-lactam-binding protein with PASTA domain
MNRKHTLIIILVSVLAGIGIGAGIFFLSSGGEDDYLPVEGRRDVYIEREEDTRRDELEDVLQVFPDPDVIKMPKLVGMDYDEAIAQYPEMNFNFIQEYSSEYEKGQVMRQGVLAGEDVRTGHRIDIWVSMGAQLVELHNYEGGTSHIDEVRARLARQGFAEENISVINEESEHIPAGYVIRTDPPAGAMIPLDTRITVWVSFGD